MEAEGGLVLLRDLVHELPEGARIVRIYSTGSAGFSLEAQVLVRLTDEVRCLRVDLYRAVMLLAGASNDELPDYPDRILDAPSDTPAPLAQPTAADRDVFLQAIGGVTYIPPTPAKG